MIEPSRDMAFNPILDALADAIFICNIQTGGFDAVNAAACNMFGYSKDELLKSNVELLSIGIPPYTKEAAFELFGKAMAAPQMIEWRCKRKDGSAFWVEISIRTVVLNAATVGLAALRDVTDRKSNAEHLQDALRFNTLLLDVSPIGILSYTIDGKCVAANPAVANMVGAPVDVLRNQNFRELESWKISGLLEMAERTFTNPASAPFSQDIYITTTFGNTRWLHTRMTIFEDRGEPFLLVLFLDITGPKTLEGENARYLQKVEQALMQTVGAATTIMEKRDRYTSGHERRVADLAVAISELLGYNASRQEGLRVCGCLHDLGKIDVPLDILSKPGKLSAIEFSLVKEHARAGYDILKDIDFPWPVADTALQHHERIDGSGYPQGLKGNFIIEEARIIAVADVVESMVSHRPYRPGLGVEKALAEIQDGRGSRYDPNVVDACLRLFKEKNYKIPDAQ